MTADEMGEAVSRAVTRLVGHDALHVCWRTPGTGMPSFGFWHRLAPDVERAQLGACYAGREPAHPAELVRRGVLGHVVDARDRRGHRILLDNGFSGELRLLLRGAHGVWGTLALFREQGGRPFEQDDVERVARLAGPLVSASRRYVTAPSLRPSGPDLAPGVIVVGADHAVRAISPDAHAWLREIRLPGSLARPEWAATALSCEVAMAARRFVRDPASPRPVACLPSAYAGRWVSVHGQALDADGRGDVAVLVQQAGRELLPALASWYGVTGRERAVLAHLREGIPAKQIARLLEVSVHTVNEHLKAVYRKTGGAGRDEIAAVLSR
ncbi:helix-turn-helix transcriptional regulator [Amycolatopsis eburnea]|uniref:Helix-turn-helix transcriptional regulator n=1 Tax=Amycolatopsis eburnea TaxID=2267691 RepID=A0A3R9F3W2_9PSEU|nr:helix-turn-helix transcriptional regulator [Amycolatopsis eburnea]RSD10358.1 helix-turn-helix transcriptional regulator [Amycolatopsis eburnea]